MTSTTPYLRQSNEHLTRKLVRAEYLARASLDTRLAPETNNAPHQPWRRLEPGPPIGEEAYIP